MINRQHTTDVPFRDRRDRLNQVQADKLLCWKSAHKLSRNTVSRKNILLVFKEDSCSSLLHPIDIALSRHSPMLFQRTVYALVISFQPSDISYGCTASTYYGLPLNTFRENVQSIRKVPGEKQEERKRTQTLQPN